MQIGRAELFQLMGIEGTTGMSVTMESEDGFRRANVHWDEDSFTADVSQAIPGESGDTILSLEGSYDPGNDIFDVSAEDRRDEASDRHDVRSVASAFHFMTNRMTTVE